MAQQDFDQEASRRSYGKPYGGKHQIPTIQGYREHQAELSHRLKETEVSQEEQSGQQDSKSRRAYDSVKAIIKGEDQPDSTHDPYPTTNRNDVTRPKAQQGQGEPPDDKVGSPHNQAAATSARSNDGANTSKDQVGSEQSAPEAAAGHIDPKQKRKDMKHIKRSGGTREVTDPVTHLPVAIHDQTDKDLSAAPENEPEVGLQLRSTTGLSAASKSREQLDTEQREIGRGQAGMQKLFPPPDFEDTKQEIVQAYRVALTTGLLSIAGIFLVALLVVFAVYGNTARALEPRSTWFQRESPQDVKTFPWTTTVIVLVSGTGLAIAVTTGVTGWLGQKIDDIFDDEVWDAARRQESETNSDDAEFPESVAWLNSLLASVWPLINPDLFASLVDTLEDVMQASLPKVVRMVSVDDLGQGSESVRILGVRWLPSGAASQSVDADGNIRSAAESHSNDRVLPGEGDQEQGNTNGKHDTQEPSAGRQSKDTSQQQMERKQEQEAIREGMEAEEGDFVNVELAFAYRARSSGKSIKAKAKNAHLYLKFYLPGGIAVPVWVELRGIVGLMRMRLQLTPDPPFFSLCTLTFLGQPRASLSCVPLSKHSLNLMDVPLISSFVQSAIDAALAEYVAPKSLTLDLKDMLVGDDFKKDTNARGVVLLFIKHARGFKEGDGGVGPMTGSSDAYVTVSWGKFGKPVASTRIIEGEQEPNWHEWSTILVSPDEINADETLRVQLWDSDKWTADDDLGRVEIPLRDLMYSPKTKNQLLEREDSFTAEDPDEKMPGTLSWSVGFYTKTHVSTYQLEHQTYDTRITTHDQLKEHVAKGAEAKLREATTKDESRELKQQKVQDYKELEDEMIISAPPPDEQPAGILSIQIHNVTGLQVASTNRKTQKDDQEQEDEGEGSDNLPDSYCTIMLNHRKIYRTRTKPKNAKPFFNAGTERFVRDWRSAEVMISVRDSREREDDALLGIVYLPLQKVLAKRSQIISSFPLAGGIGYGRARISLLWRSVDLTLPKELSGWDLGTLEVKGPITIKQNSQRSSFSELKIKSSTDLSSAKWRPGEHGWHPKRGQHDDSVFLALRKRYSTPLVLEFQKKSVLGSDNIEAFSVLWLNEIPDEENATMALPVWKGGKDNLKRAKSCCEYSSYAGVEQPLGEIQLTVHFWRGLSGFHKGYASKARSGDMRQVMEVLDTINDEQMNLDDDDDDDGGGGDKVDDSSGDGDSSSSDNESDLDDTTEYEGRSRDIPDRGDGDRSGKAQKRKDLRKAQPEDGAGDGDKHVSSIKDIPSKLKQKAASLLDPDSGQEDDGSRGAVAQIQDYKKHHKRLHRKHKGVMQWKSVRTMDWAVGKLNRGKGRISELFEHGEKDQPIETEV